MGASFAESLESWARFSMQRARWYRSALRGAVGNRAALLPWCGTGRAPRTHRSGWSPGRSARRYSKGERVGEQRRRPDPAGWTDKANAVEAPIRFGPKGEERSASSCASLHVDELNRGAPAPVTGTRLFFGTPTWFASMARRSRESSVQAPRWCCAASWTMFHVKHACTRARTGGRRDNRAPTQISGSPKTPMAGVWVGPDGAD